MKVAIVGTSHSMNDNEVSDVRQLCFMILKDFDPTQTTIITGGAKGVDTTAQEIAPDGCWMGGKQEKKYRNC